MKLFRIGPEVAVAAAILAVWAAGPAAARTFTLTFHGTVTSDYEQNAFGVAMGTNTFVGQAFASSFMADTSIYEVWDAGNQTYEAYAPNSTTTVGGRTYAFRPSKSGFVGGYSISSNFGEEETGSTNTFDGPNSDFNFAVLNGVNGYPYLQSGIGTGGYAEADAWVFNRVTGDFESHFFIEASITSVTVSDVPEPSTWAMLALGFAGLGFAGLRHARRAAESARA